MSRSSASSGFSLSGWNGARKMPVFTYRSSVPPSMDTAPVVGPMVAMADRLTTRPDAEVRAKSAGRPQRLPHPIRGADHALADDELRAHEDERAGPSHHLATRLDELADLHRIDEVDVEMHGRLRPFAVRVPARHAHGAVREGHQHAALQHVAAIVVLWLDPEP